MRLILVLFAMKSLTVGGVSVVQMDVNIVFTLIVLNLGLLENHYQTAPTVVFIALDLIMF